MSCLSQTSTRCTRVQPSSETELKIEINGQRLISASTQEQRNGQSAQDTPRKEGGKEAQGCPQCLQQQAHPQHRASAGEEKAHQAKQRILTIENASEVKKTQILYADTTEELEHLLFERYPFDPEYIGLAFYSAKSGSTGRNELHGKINPSQEDIFVRLYLKKHPRLPSGLK